MNREQLSCPSGSQGHYSNIYDERDAFQRVTNDDVWYLCKDTGDWQAGNALPEMALPAVSSSRSEGLLARASGLIASVPERHSENLRAGMLSFALPVATPEITVYMLGHPTLDADPAHRWLRGHVKDVCAALKMSDAP